MSKAPENAGLSVRQLCDEVALRALYNNRCAAVTFYRQEEAELYLEVGRREINEATGRRAVFTDRQRFDCTTPERARNWQKRLVFDC